MRTPLNKAPTNDTLTIVSFRIGFNRFQGSFVTPGPLVEQEASLQRRLRGCVQFEPISDATSMAYSRLHCPSESSPIVNMNMRRIILLP